MLDRTLIKQYLFPLNIFLYLYFIVFVKLCLSKDRTWCFNTYFNTRIYLFQQHWPYLLTLRGKLAEEGMIKEDICLGTKATTQRSETWDTKVKSWEFSLWPKQQWQEFKILFETKNQGLKIGTNMNVTKYCVLPQPFRLSCPLKAKPVV